MLLTPGDAQTRSDEEDIGGNSNFQKSQWCKDYVKLQLVSMFVALIIHSVYQVPDY